MSRFSFVGRLLLVPCLLCFAVPETVSADEPKADYPLVVIQSAGVDRLVADVKGVLATAGRKDLGAAVSGVMGILENLKGVDRKKPLGVMLYFSKDGKAFDIRKVPEPTPVVYLPVTSVEDLQTAVAIGPIKLTPTDAEKGWYVLDFSDADGQKIPCRLVNGYMYFSPKKSALERTFPSPAKLSGGGKTVPDLSLTVLAQRIPKDLKDMVLDGIRANTEKQLGKQRGELEEDYKLRVAMLKRAITTLESALYHATEIKLAGDLDTTGKGIEVRATVAAKADTPFAKFLNSAPVISTAFAPLFDDKAPAQAAFALDIGDPLREFIKAKLTEVQKKAEQPLPDADVELIKPIFGAIKKSVSSSQTEFFAKLVGEPPHPFALLAGMTHAGGKDFPAQMAKVLARAREGYSLFFVEPSALKHGGYPIHRINQPQAIDKGLAAIFGKNAKAHVAVLPNKILVSFGEDEALAALKDAIDTSAKKPTAKKTTPAMFKAQLRLAAWQGVIQQANPEAAELITKALAKGGDEISGAIERGKNRITVRVKVGPGLVRLIGLGIAKAIDEGN